MSQEKKMGFIVGPDDVIYIAQVFEDGGAQPIHALCFARTQDLQAVIDALENIQDALEERNATRILH